MNLTFSATMPEPKRVRFKDMLTDKLYKYIGRYNRGCIEYYFFRWNENVVAVNFTKKTIWFPLQSTWSGTDDIFEQIDADATFDIVFRNGFLANKG